MSDRIIKVRTDLGVGFDDETGWLRMLPEFRPQKTQSRIYAPLIYCAAHKDQRAEAWWAHYFGPWRQWMQKIEAAIHANAGLLDTNARGTTPIYYSQRQGVCAHYTAAQQCRILSTAGVKDEVDLLIQIMSAEYHATPPAAGDSANTGTKRVEAPGRGGSDDRKRRTQHNARLVPDVSANGFSPFQ